MSLLSRFVPSRVAVLAALVGLAAAPAAHAQSLSELLEAARNYDATFLSSKAQTDVARARAEQTGSLRLPNLGASASVTRSNTDFPYLPSGSNGSLSTTRQVALTLQQSLFNRANDFSIDQADTAVNLSEVLLLNAEQDLAVRVAQAYFDALAAQDTLTTIQASKKAVAEQLSATRRSFEVGLVPIIDEREAQARFDLAVAQELAAESDLRSKLDALDGLVGRRQVAPKSLRAPVSLPMLQPVSVDEWIAAAERNSLRIRQAQLELDTARAETAKAEAGHLPTVSLSASYARLQQDYATRTTPSQAYDGFGSNGSIGITVNVPLFAGFAIQGRVKETLALEEKARLNLADVRRTVVQGTRTAFDLVLSGLTRVKSLETAETSSKTALEATQKGYQVGMRVNLDVLNAQAQLSQTQRDLAKARYDTLMISLKLRQLTGQLVQGDIDAITQLLAP
jgi:outer membrane protein